MTREELNKKRELIFQQLEAVKAIIETPAVEEEKSTEEA